MNKFLQRLLAPRRRATPELLGSERVLLLATVADNDPCLRAVFDMLEDDIEVAFKNMIDPEVSASVVRVARHRMAIAYDLMRRIEKERAQGKEEVARITAQREA